MFLTKLKYKWWFNFLFFEIEFIITINLFTLKYFWMLNLFQFDLIQIIALRWVEWLFKFIVVVFAKCIHVLKLDMLEILIDIYVLLFSIWTFGLIYFQFYWKLNSISYFSTWSIMICFESDNLLKLLLMKTVIWMN